MRRIYLDYASLTPIDGCVLREMKKYSGAEYANPSSWYKEGVNAKNAMNDGRKMIAEFIHAHPDEIFFTSGGTEANNIAILGPIERLHSNGVECKDMHILLSEIEHSSVLECVSELKKRGVQVDYVGVDSSGVVKLDELKKKIKVNTVVVSIMMVNNETGVIQPIREIAKLVRHARNSFTETISPTSPTTFPRGESPRAAKPRENVSVKSRDGFRIDDRAKYPLFHTDAAQAVCYQELNVEQLGIDLLTLDASKAYGPRGIGALFIRRNSPIKEIIFGGGQEKGIRSGTENIPGIMGLAKAVDIIRGERGDERSGELERIKVLRQYFIDGLKSIRADIVIHGNIDHVSPHIVNVSIPNIDNEFFLFQLDAHGIACSTKSSCLRDADESYVLKAMGANSKSSIRFSFGRFTKKRHIKKALRIINLLILQKHV